jgi:hypothetical protein
MKIKQEQSYSDFTSLEFFQSDFARLLGFIPMHRHAPNSCSFDFFLKIITVSLGLGKN